MTHKGDGSEGGGRVGESAELGKSEDGGEHSATQGVGSVNSLTLDPNLLFAQIKGHTSICPNSTDGGGGARGPATGEKHLVAP